MTQVDLAIEKGRERMDKRGEAARGRERLRTPDKERVKENVSMSVQFAHNLSQRVSVKAVE